jgi:hypothetical protein
MTEINGVRALEGNGDYIDELRQEPAPLVDLPGGLTPEMVQELVDLRWELSGTRARALKRLLRWYMGQKI